MAESTRALAGPEFGVRTHIVFEDSLLSDKGRELESWLKTFQEFSGIQLSINHHWPST